MGFSRGAGAIAYVEGTIGGGSLNTVFPPKKFRAGTVLFVSDTNRFYERTGGASAPTWTQFAASGGNLVQTAFTEITVDTTTTSLTFVQLMSLNVTTVGGNLIISLTACGSNSANNTDVTFGLLVDGVFKRGCSFTSTGTGHSETAALVYKATGLAAGAHTIAVQWKVQSGTGSISPVSDTGESASLLVQEVVV